MKRIWCVVIFLLLAAFIFVFVPNKGEVTSVKASGNCTKTTYENLDVLDDASNQSTGDKITVDVETCPYTDPVPTDSPNVHLNFWFGGCGWGHGAVMQIVHAGGWGYGIFNLLRQGTTGSHSAPAYSGPWPSGAVYLTSWSARPVANYSYMTGGVNWTDDAWPWWSSCF